MTGAHEKMEVERAAAGDEPASRPTVRLRAGAGRRARAGHPWVYSNEVEMDAEARSLAPGTLVTLCGADGSALGVATFNPHTLIAARILTRDAGEAIDARFFEGRLRRALALRERLYPAPFYRLVHSEADRLPGLVVDRFGEAVSCQLNTAGAERLRDVILAAMETVLRPTLVVLRNDSPARAQEGLDRRVEVVKGAVEGPVAVEENGLVFLADLVGGQKTGWFYDQRENRAFVARLSRGARLLDLYAYTGAFAIAAACAGAVEAVGIDRSGAALALAEEAARRNGVEARCRFRRGEAFAELARLAEGDETFHVVVADPPPFVKSRKGLAVGARGYRKLARLAARVVAPGGLLCLASCSHLVDRERFAEEIRRGVDRAGRDGRILRVSGAAPDHPVDLRLAETDYLKFFVLQLD